MSTPNSLQFLWYTYCKLLHPYLHVKGYVSVTTPNSLQLEVEPMEGHHLGVVVWFLREYMLYN